MDLYQNVLLCILLPLVAIIGTMEGAPAHKLHQRQVPESSDQLQDVRWKLVSGLETTYLYINGLNQQIRDCDNQQELLSTSDKELKTTLDGVCELMSLQKVAEKIDNSSDLNAVLEQNILDSCHWLNLLVTCGDVTVSSRFLELNDTCEIGQMPRLSQYCLESRLRKFYGNIYEPVSNYHADKVSNQSALQWLQTELPDLESPIRQVITWTPGTNFTCPFSL